MDQEQAVLIHLDGTSLPKHVYDEQDLATLEDELIAVVEGQALGEFDGNEIGPTETTPFLYATDADALFRGIEPVLRANPLCQNARIVIRAGGPGAPETEIRMPMKA
jgi:hypothetical protein